MTVLAHTHVDGAFWAILLGVLAVATVIGIAGAVATVWSVMDVVRRKRTRTPLWVALLVFGWPYVGIGYWFVCRRRA